MSDSSVTLESVGVRGILEVLPNDVVGALIERRPAAGSQPAMDASGDVAGEDITSTVSALIDDVRLRGDAALLDAAARFDAIRPSRIEVPRTAWDAALASLIPEERDALRAAAHAITSFHSTQRPRATELEARPGLVLGRRPDPLRRVGVYAPGGRAAYPSSVLMGALPARLAGVAEVVVCSPCGSDGQPAAAVLAACAVAGVGRVFAAGGGSAIAALAYGTETVPRVDRVVGPGNAYVDEAKRQVARMVGIDNPAGPSELLILADLTADPRRLALEMIAQAEHDPRAACVLLAIGAPALCNEVAASLQHELRSAPLCNVARRALRSRGALLDATDVESALAFAERYAPEHLLLALGEADATLPRVRNAGTVFLGERASVVFGDYITGANHVLPTGGAARVFSGLSVDDFVRWTTWQRIDGPAAAAIAPAATRLAMMEGFSGHAEAAAAAGGVSAADSAAGGVSAGGSAASDSPSAPMRSIRPITPRPAYRSFPLYSPQRDDAELELSSNTNCWDASPRVLEELGCAQAVTLREYPTPYADALRAAIGTFRGVTAASVVTGCGSDDVLDSAVRAFCEPDDVLAHPVPTFPMAPMFARMNAARAVPVPLDGDDLDVDRVAACAPRLVYLCRPNNPTGGMLPRATVTELLDRTDALLVIDEAYGEYAGDSLLPLAMESGRALVTGTFSKAWGLAGMRIGYALGDARLIEAVQASRGPYKVGRLAEKLAIAALEDAAWMEQTVAEARASREKLASELLARGLWVRPSAANFLLFGHSGWSGSMPATVAGALRQRGIAVRAFPELRAVRVTIAPWPGMCRFLAGLDASLEAAAAGAALEVA